MVSEKLNETKKKKGLTNQTIAELSGVPLSTVTRIMSGETRDPAIDAVKKISVVLDLSLDSLYSDDIVEAANGTKYISLQMFNLMLAEKNNEIAKAHAEKRVLFLCLLACFAVIFGFLLFDALNGRVGWIRYDETAAKFAKEITTFLLKG